MACDPSLSSRSWSYVASLTNRYGADRQNCKNFCDLIKILLQSKYILVYVPVYGYCDERSRGFFCSSCWFCRFGFCHFCPFLRCAVVMIAAAAAAAVVVVVVVVDVDVDVVAVACSGVGV